MRDAFRLRDAEHDVWLSQHGSGRFRLHTGDAEPVVALHADPASPDAFSVELEGRRVAILLVRRGDEIHVHLNGRTFTVQHVHPLNRVASSAHDTAADAVRAPMPGSAVSISVGPGQTVARGQVLLVMESMKMETTLTAARDGVIDSVHAVVGQSFEKDAVLVRFRSGDGA